MAHKKLLGLLQRGHSHKPGADHWRQVQNEFAQLGRDQDQWTAVPAGPGRRLEAYSDYTVGNGETGYWILSEGPSEYIRSRFEVLATGAGAVLDSAQAEPLDYWLHRLFLIRSNRAVPNLTVRESRVDRAEM